MKRVRCRSRRNARIRKPRPPSKIPRRCIERAIRHAASELERQDARTKLLIVLSDGRPYDHDYGDSRYAREDTKMALRQTKIIGITPFCITIDRESEAELKDLYGEVGYTIIDDVMSLPERLPGIYRRLTT